MNYKDYKHIMKQNDWSETIAVKHYLANATYWNKKYKEALDLMKVGILDYEPVVEAYNNKVNEIHKALSVAKFENNVVFNGKLIDIWNDDLCEVKEELKRYIANKQKEQQAELDNAEDSYLKELLVKVHKEEQE